MGLHGGERLDDRYSDLERKGLEVSCLNVSCGYYNAHTDEEITVKKDLMKSLLFVEHIIEDCTNTYPHTQSDPYFSPYEFEDEIYDILNNDPTLTPEDLYEMYSTDFPHLRPDDYERICRDYRMLWKEYEEYKLINGSGYENEKILS